jgi:hypothetical protein
MLHNMVRFNLDLARLDLCKNEDCPTYFPLKTNPPETRDVHILFICLKLKWNPVKWNLIKPKEQYFQSI